MGLFLGPNVAHEWGAGGPPLEIESEEIGAFFSLRWVAEDSRLLVSLDTGQQVTAEEQGIDNSGVQYTLQKAVKE